MASSSSDPALPPPQPPPPPPAPVPVHSHPSQEHMYKNRLQEFTGKSNIAFPKYQTVNEGQDHVPEFRSTVWVAGTSYTSDSTFSQKRAAEQDAARIALESILQRTRDEGLSLVNEISPFFKCIMNVYADKLHVEQPTYNTVKQQLGGELHDFISSLVFNDTKYTGDPARTKKEAEQSAAKAAILSIMGDSSMGTKLIEIIKSKSIFYDAIKGKRPSLLQASSVLSTANAGHISVTQDKKDTGVAASMADNNNEAKVEFPESSNMLSTCQELQMPIQESSLEANNVPLQPGSAHSIDNNTTSKKRRKNKKANNKKARLESSFPISAIPMNPVPPCPAVPTSQVPPPTAVVMSQVPPPTAVLTSQVPPRTAVLMSQVPPRTTVPMNQVLPFTAVPLNQVTRNTVPINYVYACTSVLTNQVRPCTAVSMIQAPPLTAVSMSQAPPCTAVSMIQAPPRTAVSMNQAPPCTAVSMNQAPPCTAVSMSQAPPCTAVSMNQAPPCTAVSMNQAPPCTAVSMNQAPPRTVAPMNQAPPRTVAPMNQAPPRTVAPMNQVPPCTAAPMNQVLPL